MKLPFTLVQSKGSSDTAKCVAELHAGVRAKRVIGLAYAVIYAERNYEVHVCGEAARSPTFARGCVATLNDELGARIRGEKT